MTTGSTRAARTVWRFEVPRYLPPSLNELIGCRPGKRHRLKSECAAMLGTYAAMAGVPRVDPDKPRRRRVRFTLTGWPRGRAGDPDNYLKALLDGLTVARLIVDDGARWCTWTTPAVVRSARRSVAVEIEDLPERAKGASRG